MHVTFPSADLTLEGHLTLLSGATQAAVICHPHPQYGGDMDNSVVGAIETGLQRAGFATLRFNFRGVGRSTGLYGSGAGEQDDTHAAVTYLRQHSGVTAVTAAGFSFGAMVALRAGAASPAVDRLIGIAPPLTVMDLHFLEACGKRKLFVVGDRDQYCSVTALQQQLTHVADPKHHVIVAGADHFLSDYDDDIAAAVQTFVARA